MKLRTEIIFLVGIVTLGVGLGSTFLASRIMHHTLEENLRNQAEVTALNFSNLVTPWVKAKDTAAINSEIQNLIECSPHVQYVFVIDFDHNLIAHSFDGPFPENLALEFLHNDHLNLDNPIIKQFLSKPGEIMDVGLPLVKGKSAQIHIGMDESRLHSRVDNIRNRILSLTLILAAAGIALSYFVSMRLTEPVQEELKKLSLAVTQSPTSILITDAEGIIEYVNPKFEDLTGYSLKESLGKTASFLRSGLQDDDYYAELWKTIKQGDVWRGEFSNKKKNGELYWESATISPILNDQGTITHFIAVKEDITKSKHFKEALRESETRTRATFNAISDAVFLHPLLEEGFATFLDVNDTACKTYGYTREQFKTMKAPDITLDSDAQKYSKRYFRKVMKDQVRMVFETTHVKSSGEEFPVEINSTVLKLSGVPTILSVVRDLTLRKEEEKEHAKLQMQFIQSQKMETVGRLAGGIAHDFNNMMGVIVGHTDLALLEKELSKTSINHLVEIQKAASRSANLTRQLLAFARKQTINPEVLDLNATMEEMLKMLRQLMGEDIDLTWLPGSKIWPIIVDPSQIDQIMANLCVNARDAISGGGKVTIETGTATFDDKYCSTHPGFRPGQFTLIAVSDNGSGMNASTLDKVFEPFFTTKPTGEGTGLGLSTIYGIVKQNDGFINVYSEPNIGSTFKIYLPRHLGEMPEVKPEEQKGTAATGHETILIVEDEESILKMTTGILEKQGYTVISTSSPKEAIAIASESSKDIQLIITDVVMPEINGNDLVKKVLEYNPKIKCLYMSGYTANVISNHGVLEDGVHFLPKPFTLASLASTVRKILDDNENG